MIYSHYIYEVTYFAAEVRGVPSLWPPGQYALVTFNFECPEKNSKGWRKSMLQVSSAERKWEYTFCAKWRHDPSLDTGSWVPGEYTIFKMGKSCPEGL